MIEGEPSGFDRDGFIIYGAWIIAMLVCLILGRWLLRGRRRLVLFLRRFGFVGATEVLTFALANAIGSSWRLITLDDSAVSPVGASGRIRWITLSAIALSILIPTGVILWGLLFGFNLIKPIDAGDGLIGGLLTLFSVLILVVVVVVIATFMALAFLLLGLFSLGSYLAVRRAETSKRIAIPSAEQIEAVSRSVARRVRSVISPKLVVVSVADTVWQETVRRLAAFSAAIVIDVSEPTSNLLWEVSTLKPELRLHWILVAEKERLNSWTAATGSDLNQKLLALLDGDTVLAYSLERADRKRFARSLRNRLDALSRSDI
jgi:hypothetical protein